MTLAHEQIERTMHGPEETLALGRRLADFLQPGDTIALYGDLGSGKTVMTKGICAGLGVNDPVTSPSFTLIQEYYGRMMVYHLDFYRLNSETEIEDLDIDRYLDNDGVCVVEWAERGEALLPEDRFSVRFQRMLNRGTRSTQERILRISAPGGRGIEAL